MKKYKQVNMHERSQIEVLRKHGYSLRSIARVLGRSPSTISREINRHSTSKKIYKAHYAQKSRQKKIIYQRRKAPLKSILVYMYVKEKLKERWSPEQIAGRISMDLRGTSIHYTTIYKYIKYRANQQEELSQYIRPKRKRSMKRKYLKDINKRRIADRPSYIDTRIEIGDWETDLMEGKRSDNQVVSVTTERKTRYMVAGITSKKAKSKSKDLLERLNDLPVNTITTDNGSENAEHRLWEKRLNTRVYFCNPYRSWEKGSVENAIGRIRRYMPKGETLNELKEHQLQSYVDNYNNTPRKCLNYLTPTECFMREL